MMRALSSALSILAIVIGACGGGSGPGAVATSAATASATGAKVVETADQAMARLYDLAKAEGQINLYSSLNTDDAGKILPVFMAKFPGIKVNHTRASGEALVQRLVTEKKAGQDLMDVVESNLFEVKFIVDQGYTQPYKIASWDDFPAALKDPNGAYMGARMNNDIPGVNTSKMNATDIKTWMDLCDPKYKGHVAVEMGDVVIYSSLRKILGETQAQSFLKCLAANQPSLRTGHTEMANLLAAGEFWVTLSSNGHRLAQLKNEEKKPIDWARTPQIITDTQPMALANKPPHPNAAKLFFEWFGSPDGQKAIVSTGRVAASTKVTPKYPDLNNFAPIFYISADLAKDFDKDAEFWRATFGIK